jgi:hypothetical protein
MSANEKLKDEQAGGTEQERGVRQIENVPVESQRLPLFLRGGSEGQKGNAQDEKDETAE